MFFLINMHYDENLIKQYLQQKVSLPEVSKKLNLNISNSRYLQSEFNNYVGGEYATVEDALKSIKIHLK